LLAAGVWAGLPDAYLGPEGLLVAFTPAGRATAAVAVWMAAWWLSEAIPVYATALLPLVLFPLLGATTMKAAAVPYSHELIFLFMGGFMIALSMQRHQQHSDRRHADPDPRSARPGARHRATRSGSAGCAGGELRVHAPRGDTPERDRFRVGAGHDLRDEPRGLLAQLGRTALITLFGWLVVARVFA
jgi:hypothetical protein